MADNNNKIGTGETVQWVEGLSFMQQNGVQSLTSEMVLRSTVSDSLVQK